MASFTDAEIKEYVPRIANWSAGRAAILMGTAEAILAGFKLDSTVTGYADLYKGAVISLVDMIAENPTGLKSSGLGKQSKVFAVELLPLPCQRLIEMSSAGIFLSGAVLQRSDIGLR